MRSRRSSHRERDYKCLIDGDKKRHYYRDGEEVNESPYLKKNIKCRRDIRYEEPVKCKITKDDQGYTMKTYYVNGKRVPVSQARLHRGFGETCERVADRIFKDCEGCQDDLVSCRQKEGNCVRDLQDCKVALQTREDELKAVRRDYERNLIQTQGLLEACREIERKNNEELKMLRNGLLAEEEVRRRLRDDMKLLQDLNVGDPAYAERLAEIKVGIGEDLAHRGRIIEDLEARIKTLTDERDEARRQSDTLRRQIGEVEVKSRDSCVLRLAEAKQEYDKALNDVSANSNKLASDLEECARKLTDIYEKNRELEAERTRLVSSLSASTEKVGSLEEELKKASVEFNVNRARGTPVRGSQDQIVALTRELHDATTERETCLKELMEVKTSLADLAVREAENKLQASEAIKLLSEYESEVQALNKEITNLKGETEETRTQVSSDLAKGQVTMKELQVLSQSGQSVAAAGGTILSPSSRDELLQLSEDDEDESKVGIPPAEDEEDKSMTGIPSATLLKTPVKTPVRSPVKTPLKKANLPEYLAEKEESRPMEEVLLMDVDERVKRDLEKALKNRDLSEDERNAIMQELEEIENRQIERGEREAGLHEATEENFDIEDEDIRSQEDDEEEIEFDEEESEEESGEKSEKE